MSEKIEIKVDATYGVKVKVGDNVDRGQEIGKASCTGQMVTASISGVVREIRFEPQSHEFAVVLKS
ncbi:MAG: hypothetical protein FVQ80_13870 [Planctomycetes bacterium]|nr:hypothetical protein [Planctomycetota bacterium]